MQINDTAMMAKKVELASEMIISQQVAGVIQTSKGLHGFVLGGGGAHDVIMVIQALREMSDDLTKNVSGQLGEERYQKLYDEIKGNTRKEMVHDETEITERGE